MAKTYNSSLIHMHCTPLPCAAPHSVSARLRDVPSQIGRSPFIWLPLCNVCLNCLGRNNDNKRKTTTAASLHIAPPPSKRDARKEKQSELYHQCIVVHSIFVSKKKRTMWK